MYPPRPFFFHIFSEMNFECAEFFYKNRNQIRLLSGQAFVKDAVTIKDKLKHTYTI